MKPKRSEVDRLARYLHEQIASPASVRADQSCQRVTWDQMQLGWPGSAAALRAIARWCLANGDAAKLMAAAKEKGNG